MRSNSGAGDSSNNLHDPTLRDQERKKGKSGEAGLGTDQHSQKKMSPDSGPARQ